ncbi:uncharacterized protein LOC101452592 [Ceratitis capitata]|uniref:uncharacterized protein LOC101452592 n=1 Tax=Ceratitis capitata TaxID=7213 RepID=UPI00061880B7|nr:uncharacterized protein LOC101452592 [Ceratitis capitata]
MKIICYLLFAAQFLATNSAPRLYSDSCDFEYVSDYGNETGRPIPANDLGTACAQAFPGRRTESAVYKNYLGEGYQFEHFLEQMEAYEAKKSGRELCHNDEYALFLDDRRRFYKKANFLDCYNKAAGGAKDFKLLECVVDERKKITKAIMEEIQTRYGG